MSYILPPLNSRILQAFPVDLPRLAKFREPSPNCEAAIKPEMEIHLVWKFMTIILHSYLLCSSDTSKKRDRSEFSCIVTCQGLYVTPLLLSYLSLLLFYKELVLVCNEPELKLWIPVLWIPHMTQFHTRSNNIVSNMGPTSLSISKAILNTWYLARVPGLTIYWHHSRDQSPHKNTSWSNSFPIRSQLITLFLDHL